MGDWEDRLNEKKLLVADGAWGTELAKLGLPVGEAPEAWNSRHPDKVRSIASAYVEAGADIVLTNTFGGSRLKLARSGLAERTDELNRLGAALSREAAGGQALVFASVGPTGEFMEPVGTRTEPEMVACFAEQVKALCAGGADGIVIETMSDLNEARAALKAVRESCELPAVFVRLRKLVVIWLLKPEIYVELITNHINNLIHKLLIYTVSNVKLGLSRLKLRNKLAKV